MNEGQSTVDSAVDAPYAGFMNLQVPPELEAKLTRLAVETGRTAEFDLLASSVDHDEWFRAEVEKGRASAREGRLLEHLILRIKDFVNSDVWERWKSNLPCACDAPRSPDTWKVLKLPDTLDH